MQVKKLKAKAMQIKVKAVFYYNAWDTKKD